MAKAGLLLMALLAALLAACSPSHSDLRATATSVALDVAAGP